MSQEEDQMNHIENVPKPLVEQKSPYKDQNAEPEEVKQGPFPSYSFPNVQPLTNTTTGPLKYIGDPLGAGLGAVLKPVGAGLGFVTKPLGDTLGGATKPALGPLMGKQEEKMEALGGENKDSYIHGKTTTGGHVQSGENPLGLNQTGSDEFRD